MDIRPHQIWEFRLKESAPWRRVKVTNVFEGEVEFQYLDMPEATDLAKTFTATVPDMLTDSARYRLISNT
jgi:hypothetical protein